MVKVMKYSMAGLLNSLWYLHWAGGIHITRLNSGCCLAFLDIAFANGLLICLISNAPNLATGKAPTTIVDYNSRQIFKVQSAT